MKKWLPLFFSFVLMLSACDSNEKEEIKEEGLNEEQLIEQYADDKMNNPKLLQDDELLKVGDLKVEKEANIEHIQNPPSDFEKKMAEKYFNTKSNNGIANMHHSGKYPQLHPVFVNPVIKPLGGDYAENVIQYAWKLYGTPYEYGSDRSNAKTFDCSDFTRWVNLYALGLDLPKTSRSQWEYVKKFSPRAYTELSKAKRGDLLFFTSYMGWKKEDYEGIDIKAQPVAHSGIYLGDGMMLHTASAKTGGVRVDKIIGSHLEYRFIGGGSVIQPN